MPKPKCPGNDEWDQTHTGVRRSESEVIGNFTVSIGIALAHAHDTLETLIGRADAGMYAGVAFFRANESFWLADVVPPEFIR